MYIYTYISTHTYIYIYYVCNAVLIYIIYIYYVYISYIIYYTYNIYLIYNIYTYIYLFISYIHCSSSISIYKRRLDYTLHLSIKTSFLSFSFTLVLNFPQRYYSTVIPIFFNTLVHSWARVFGKFCSISSKGQTSGSVDRGKTEVSFS